MKRLFFILLISVFIIGVYNTVHAKTYYIRADAAGTGTGEDWTNAYPSFKVAGLYDNKSTAPRGHTYYIADGKYGACIFIND